MGVDYRADQARLGRVFALRMTLDGPHAGPKSRDRFRRAAEAMLARFPDLPQAVFAPAPAAPDRPPGG
jgi:hypothetical protein